MAKKTLTSVSVNEDVIQELHWDDVSEKIEVVHEINLNRGKNAMWNSVRTYKPGDQDYDDKVIRYVEESRRPGFDYPITEYIYDEYNDPNELFDHAEKFPENGEYYPLSTIEHLVGVIMNRIPAEEPPEQSKTSGEAL